MEKSTSKCVFPKKVHFKNLDVVDIALEGRTIRVQRKNIRGDTERNPKTRAFEKVHKAMILDISNETLTISDTTKTKKFWSVFQNGK